MKQEPVGSLGRAACEHSEGSLGCLLAVAITPLTLCQFCPRLVFGFSAPLDPVLPSERCAVCQRLLVLWECWGLGRGSASWSISVYVLVWFYGVLPVHKTLGM